MDKKVNFYKVELYSSSGKESHKEIKNHFIRIIDAHSLVNSGIHILQLSNVDGLHVIADIFEYEHDILFMRLSGQKPNGSYIQRDYNDNIPKPIFEGHSEEEQGIEAYTYVYFRYDTGILEIVNNSGAPNYKKMNDIIAEYETGYALKFYPVPNTDGIDLIYGQRDSAISKIEIEVPVPNADMLERVFGWDTREILDVQQNSLKAVLELSGIDRKKITTTGEETDGLIDIVKDSIKYGVRKAKLRGKIQGKKAQDYNFFTDNFTYYVDITDYRIVDKRKKYLTAKELISEYKEHLEMAYYENENMLRSIADRCGGNDE